MPSIPNEDILQKHVDRCDIQTLLEGRNQAEASLAEARQK